MKFFYTVFGKRYFNYQQYKTKINDVNNIKQDGTRPKAS